MKVRIKKSPRTGDQRDYSLTTHRPWSPSNTEDPDGIKNTMGAVPRHMANIEAEGGETILGDINNDGNIEHMTITGKRHTQGGVPLNVPPGSFIFSDTNKMKIKDQNVLAHFGMGTKKGGYTPAEIAKRYQLNDFMKKLNSPDTDPMTRRTAERMLNNNMQKLSELAAYQEGMKGKQPPAVSQQMLPDGGQQMNENAEPSEAYMMQNGMDELEMAYGGRIQHMQTGGYASNYLFPGSEIYVGNQKVKIAKVDDNLIGTDYVHFATPVNGVKMIPKEDFLNYFNTNKQYPAGTNYQISHVPGEEMVHNVTTLYFGSTPQRVNNNKGVIVSGIGEFQPNTVFQIGSDRYKVEDASLMGNSGKRILTVKNLKTNETQYFNGDQIREAHKNKDLVYVKGNQFIVPGTPNGPAEDNQIGLTLPTNTENIPSQQNSFTQTAPAQNTPTVKKETGSVRQQTSGTPTKLKAQPSKVKVYESVDELYNDKWQELQDKAMGGNIYAEGGITDEPRYKYDPVQRKMVPIMQTAGTTPSDTGEKEYVEEYEVKGVGKHKRITKGNKLTIIGPDNKVVRTGNIEDDYNTYSPQDITALQNKGFQVKLPKPLEAKYANDKTEGRQGIRYDKDGRRIYGTQDYGSGEFLQDFQDRFADYLKENPNYTPGTNDEHFQNWYNNDLDQYADKSKMTPEEKKKFKEQFGFQAGSKDPNALDNKFGRYTWSRPRFKFEEKPQPQTVYRCPTCQPVQVPADYKITAEDYTSQSACQTACSPVKNPPPPQTPPDNDFWIQHKLGIANAMNMDRFYGAPAMFQVNGATYDPQLEEYSAKNASLQSDASLAMSNINASADPTTARANIAAIAGNLGQTGVNQIADIQNRNVQTTNAVAADRAHMRNDINTKNTALRKQFFDETNQYGQNLVNSSNKQRTMITNGFNNAFQGLQNRNMMRAIYPMYDINSVTGAHGFIDGQDFTEGTYQTAPTAANASVSALVEKYRKDLIAGGLSPDEAAKQAAGFAKDELNRAHQSANITQRAYLQQNPMAAMSGMTGGYNPFE